MNKWFQNGRFNCNKHNDGTANKILTKSKNDGNEKHVIPGKPQLLWRLTENLLK